MELDRETAYQIMREEQTWDVAGYGIPETNINPHQLPCTCTPDKTMFVGGEARDDNWVSIYQCQECGNEIEYATPLDETEYMN